MEIENQTGVATAALVELARFVLGEHFEVLQNRITLIVLEQDQAPHQLIRVDRRPDGVPPTGAFTVNLAQPDQMHGLYYTLTETEFPLLRWQERFVYNLASAFSGFLRTPVLPSIRSSRERYELTMQSQQGVLLAMERFWEAERYQRFSWQHQGTG